MTETFLFFLASVLSKLPDASTKKVGQGPATTTKCRRKSADVQRNSPMSLKGSLTILLGFVSSHTRV